MLVLNKSCRPMLRPGIQCFPRPDGKIIFFEFGRAPISLADPEGKRMVLIQLLDGKHTADEIITEYSRLYPNFTSESIQKAIIALFEKKLVIDAGAPIPDALDAQDLERYARQIDFLARYETPDRNRYSYQVALKQARVTLIGLGGVGSFIAYNLVAAGIGFLRCIDGDRVERSNLNRQILYTEDDIGQLKAEAARIRLQRFNPLVQLEMVPKMVYSPDEIESYMRDVDLLICSGDIPPLELRRAVNLASARCGVPYLMVGALRVGPLVIPGQTACWACFEEMMRKTHQYYEELSQVFARARTAPSFVSIPALAGSFTALEALKFLGGFAPVATLGKIVTINMNDLTCQIDKLDRMPSCPVCSGMK
ncbi:hypothetical protein DRO69_09115 [Candidatus Bathyarchaeota archaeon]|nr:MAG: hypothetical protein DRO69_09115 [Candidatus Bathyarchaeota archaeon]